MMFDRALAEEQKKIDEREQNVNQLQALQESVLGALKEKIFSQPPVGLGWPVPAKLENKEALLTTLNSTISNLGKQSALLGKEQEEALQTVLSLNEDLKSHMTGQEARRSSMSGVIAISPVLKEKLQDRADEKLQGINKEIKALNDEKHTANPERMQQIKLEIQKNDTLKKPYVDLKEIGTKKNSLDVLKKDFSKAGEEIKALMSAIDKSATILNMQDLQADKSKGSELAQKTLEKLKSYSDNFKKKNPDFEGIFQQYHTLAATLYKYNNHSTVTKRIEFDSKGEEVFTRMSNNAHSISVHLQNKVDRVMNKNFVEDVNKGKFGEKEKVMLTKEYKRSTENLFKALGEDVKILKKAIPLAKQIVDQLPPLPEEKPTEKMRRASTAVRTSVAKASPILATDIPPPPTTTPPLTPKSEIPPPPDTTPSTGRPSHSVTPLPFDSGSEYEYEEHADADAIPPPPSSPPPPDRAPPARPSLSTGSFSAPPNRPPPSRPSVASPFEDKLLADLKLHRPSQPKANVGSVMQGLAVGLAEVNKTQVQAEQEQPLRKGIRT